jgi:phosphopantetheinyl transferase
MSSHSRQPVSEDDTPAGCWVAVLDTQSLLLTGKDYTSYLSAAEKAHHRAFRSSKRRLQWLGGRLAAKYLFLHRMELPVANEEPNWRPILLQLSVKSIDDYPIWMYQNIEVSASVDPQGTGPRLRWCGRVEGAVSLSHTGSNVCACLSQASTVGVDIESVEPRVESFYRSNYTETEKQWVNCGAGIEPLSRNWLYTLLWTFKEGALKARALLQKSPVSFAGIEVRGLPVPQGVLRAYRKDIWGDQFGQFTGRIQEERNTTGVHVAYMGTRRLILSVVKPIDTARHAALAVMS